MTNQERIELCYCARNVHIDQPMDDIKNAYIRGESYIREYDDKCYALVWMWYQRTEPKPELLEQLKTASAKDRATYLLYYIRAMQPKPIDEPPSYLSIDGFNKADSIRIMYEYIAHIDDDDVPEWITDLIPEPSFDDVGNILSAYTISNPRGCMGPILSSWISAHTSAHDMPKLLAIQFEYANRVFRKPSWFSTGDCIIDDQYKQYWSDVFAEYLVTGASISRMPQWIIDAIPDEVLSDLVGRLVYGNYDMYDIEYHDWKWFDDEYAPDALPHPATTFEYVNTHPFKLNTYARNSADRQMILYRAHACIKYALPDRLKDVPAKRINSENEYFDQNVACMEHINGYSQHNVAVALVLDEYDPSYKAAYDRRLQPKIEVYNDHEDDDIMYD